MTTDTINKPIDKDIPYRWQSVKDNMILCYGCRLKCHKDKERWAGWKLPARTIKAWGSTIHFEEGCNIKRAGILRDMSNTCKRNCTTIKTTPLPLFISQERIGSHSEWVRWNNETNELERLLKYKKGYHHRVVEEYITSYKDCLCGKEWLEKHEHDKYPEPTIELSVDGELKASINGNYKQGMIADTIKPYVKTVRAGKKTLTILNGGYVENMGGGCYIAINGEYKNGEYKYFKEG